MPPTGRRPCRTGSSPTICAPPPFLIADGVLPSKEGRGYVLRRIMRRAMRHAQMLGCKDPLMWRLVPALVQQMGAAFPELLRAQPLITETLRLEETNFRQTLERGLGLLGRHGGGAGADRRRAAVGDGRVHALRHLRLSARSDAGHPAAAAASPSISHGFESRDGRGPRPLARLLGRLGRGRDRGELVRAARRDRRRPSSSATTPKPPRA